MKKTVTVFDICVIVSFLTCCSVLSGCNNIVKRFEPEEDRWIWGYVDTTTKKSVNEVDQGNRLAETTITTVTETETKTDQSTEVSKPTIAEPDPCEPYNPPVPDFSAPERRISEIKCKEHFWILKYNEERARLCTIKNIEEHPKEVNAPEVVGGRDARPKEYPHMGAIGWIGNTGAWVFKCGATLISSKFVLTAAHCIKVSSRDTEVADVEPKIVRFGVEKIADPNARDVNITRIIAHPSYAPPVKYYDIALMELAKDVEFTEHVYPACLWHNPVSVSLLPQVTVTGWGVTKEASTVTSQDLQVATLDLVDVLQCNKLLRCNRHWCGLLDHQLCAGKLSGGVDSCQGDSGGPLQVEKPLPGGAAPDAEVFYVVGVTSFGRGCGREQSPGVYTNVASFIDWIESNVWGQN